MSEVPRVVLALSPLAEREVESLLFDSGQPPLALVASAMQADELKRTVAERRPVAVLLSPSLPDLSASHCEHMRALSARLVGLALDEREAEELRSLGVDEVIDSEVSREELVAAMRTQAGKRHPADSLTQPASPALPSKERERGSIAAVVGSKGAPGASECAASLAALASMRWPTVLVEADALGGGLDVRLHADAAQGSLVGLLRAVGADEGALRGLVERWLVQRSDWPPVLLGPPDSDALAERAVPGAMAASLEELAGLYGLVVCDVGCLLSAGEHPAARPHREALIAADLVVLVAGMGDAQMHHALSQLGLILDRLAIPQERLRIVVNGLGSPFGAGKNAIKRALAPPLAERGLAVDAVLPFDARGLARSRRTQLPIALARRRGGYARALMGFLDEVFLAAPTATKAPRLKRRKLRLHVPQPPAPQDEEVALPWRT